MKPEDLIPDICKIRHILTKVDYGFLSLFKSETYSVYDVCNERIINSYTAFAIPTIIGFSFVLLLFIVLMWFMRDDDKRREKKDKIINDDIKKELD